MTLAAAARLGRACAGLGGACARVGEELQVTRLNGQTQRVLASVKQTGPSDREACVEAGKRVIFRVDGRGRA